MSENNDFTQYSDDPLSKNLKEEEDGSCTQYPISEKYSAALFLNVTSR